MNREKAWRMIKFAMSVHAGQKDEYFRQYNLHAKDFENAHIMLRTLKNSEQVIHELRQHLGKKDKTINELRLQIAELGEQK